MSLERLPARLGTTWRLLVKEISAFGIVGGVCTVIDLGLFQLLYAHAGVGAVTARFISTVVSMTVSYFGNRHWSFSHRARTGLRREYVLFAIINTLTLFLSLGIVWFVRYPLGQDSALILQVANIISIGIGTIVRYFSYRKWVFVGPNHPAALASEPHDPAPLDRAA